MMANWVFASLPFRRRLTQDQIDEFCRGFVIGEVAADFDRPPELCVQSLNGVGNRYEMPVPTFGWDRQGPSVWCDHPGQGAGSTKWGRPMYTMS